MLAELRQKIIKVLSTKYHEHLLEKLQLHEIDIKFGDIALNIVHSLSKQLERPLLEVSSEVVELLQTLPEIDTVQAVNGFINMKLKSVVYRKLIHEILLQQDKYGMGSDKNITVNVDFASMNPTGPMHAGHLSSAILADTLCNILTFQGYNVQREYYLNDTGGQIEKLVQTIFVRYCALFDKQIDGETEYKGEYIDAIAEDIKTRDAEKWLDAEFNEYYASFREIAIKMILQDIKHDLADLGIKHDHYFSEHNMTEQNGIQEAYRQLQALQLVQKQQLQKPENYKGEYNSVEIEGLELTNQFRPIFKRDGAHTYLMGDIAYHMERAKTCDWMINCFGADHFEHANMLQEIVPQVTGKKVDVKLSQMVKFHKDGQIMKFSKRAGTYVTARDIMDSIGKDALRITMLTRKANAHFTVEMNDIMNTDDNNPVFYLQYAYARCCSVMDKVPLFKVKETSENEQQDVYHDISVTYSKPEETKVQHVDYDLLFARDYIVDAKTCPDEFINNKYIRKLLNKMLFWPEVTVQCTHNLEPHGLLVYMQEISKMFHSVWYHGATDEMLQLIKPYKDHYPGGLLTKCMQNVLDIGFNLLNITTTKSMYRNE